MHYKQMHSARREQAEQEEAMRRSSATQHVKTYIASHASTQISNYLRHRSQRNRHLQQAAAPPPLPQAPLSLGIQAAGGGARLRVYRAGTVVQAVSPLHLERAGVRTLRACGRTMAPQTSGEMRHKGAGAGSMEAAVEMLMFLYSRQCTCGRGCWESERGAAAVEHLRVLFHARFIDNRTQTI